MSVSGPAPALPRPLHRGALAITLSVLVLAQVWTATLAARDLPTFIGVAIFVTACVACYRNTLLGLAIVILVQIRALHGSKAISVEELAYAGLFFSMFLGWAVRDAPTRAGREMLRSPVSRALIVFLLAALLSIVVTMVMRWPVLWWFRDFVRFSYFLLFFPVASALSSRHGAMVVTLCALAVVLYYGAVAIVSYRSAVTMTRSLWQLKYQRMPFHEVLSMTGLVFGFGLFLRTRSRGVAALALVLALLSVLPLVVSFTRGYWLATAFACGILLVIFRTCWRRAAAFAFWLLVLIALAAYAAFQGKVVGIVVALADRFSTVAAPLRSLSVMERLAETRAVLKEIGGSPIIGQGLGAQVSYMSPVAHRVVTYTYSHNAYLFLLYKLGIVGLVLFLTFFLQGIRRVWQALVASKDDVLGAVMASGLALLVAFIPLSITSPQYYDKSSVFVIALILGAAEATVQRRRSALARGDTVA